jgi:hypothetical protein
MICGTKGIYCTACGCPKKDHKILKYEENVTQVEELVQNAENLCQAYEEENKFIIESAAKFDYFTKNNAIIVTDNSFKKSLEHLLENEESLSKVGSKNEAVIKGLRKALKEYEEKKKFLDDAKKSNTLESSVVPTTEIFKMMDELYKLKHFGEQIKELVIESKKFEDKQRARKERQIVHTLTTSELIRKFSGLFHI